MLFLFSFQTPQRTGALPADLHQHRESVEDAQRETGECLLLAESAYLSAGGEEGWPSPAGPCGPVSPGATRPHSLHLSA